MCKPGDKVKVPSEFAFHEYEADWVDGVVIDRKPTEEGCVWVKLEIPATIGWVCCPWVDGDQIEICVDYLTDEPMG